MNTHIRIGLFVLTGLMATHLSSPLQGEEPKRPNVLFLSIDDLNDWIACLGGHPQVQTPNLDRLAADRSPSCSFPWTVFREPARKHGR